MKTLDRQKLDVTNKTRRNIFGWLRNWNTVEFLGVWESICNPAFNSGEFATIKSQAGGRVNFDSNPVEFDGIRNQPT